MQLGRPCTHLAPRAEQRRERAAALGGRELQPHADDVDRVRDLGDLYAESGQT